MQTLRQERDAGGSPDQATQNRPSSRSPGWSPYRGPSSPRSPQKRCVTGRQCRLEERALTTLYTKRVRMLKCFCFRRPVSLLRIPDACPRVLPPQYSGLFRLSVWPDSIRATRVRGTHSSPVAQGCRSRPPTCQGGACTPRPRRGSRRSRRRRRRWSRRSSGRRS
jgi:hypothetical protein